MPELPEVETIVRSLSKAVGYRVEKLVVYKPVVVRQECYSIDSLTGLPIESITRRGKFIVMDLGGQHYLIWHMGMSGRLFLTESGQTRANHTHVVLHLVDAGELHYVDPRRFGGLWLVHRPEDVFGQLGPEPLGKEFSAAYLEKSLRNKKTPIKNLLLNQCVVAGIGNIYADEILFDSAISPERIAGSLDSKEIAKLHRSIKKVLRQGIECRGTTFRDYRDGFNRPGGFQEYLRVYGREGKPCLKCGNPICRIKMGGRSTHFCQHCQH
ncbi:MAG: bifunctional DNA-formamidopyrimidine glycosylase/DNA-(apurinic or apyrimidinic site) lyase [Chitinophagales bacterium]